MGVKRRIRRIFQQAVPRNYKAVVEHDGKQILMLWKMWLGKSYQIVKFEP